MKRNLLFSQVTALGKRLAMVLTMLLIVGIGQAWAETKTYSYTFTAKQFSANGSKTLNNVSWTLAGDGGYWGYDGTKGQQFGSSNDPYKTLTLSTSGISGTITKIIINTSGGSSVNASFTVSVGGTQWGNSTKLTTSATNYTFTGSKSGEIKFSYTQTSSKALYIKSISVTYETAAATVPVTGVSLNPSTLTLTEGDSETLTATVEPADATNKNVTWSSSDASVATVSNGVVTAKSAGSATITAASEADNTKKATCTVTVTAPAGGGGDGECSWTLVTDAFTLKADDEVIITASGENDYALSTNQKSSNRGATAITKNGNTLTSPSADVQILALKAGATSGTWAFYTGTSGYLYAASSSGNQLKTKTTLDVHGSWTISITDGVASIVAEGSSNRNVMQYNYNAGTPLFACYSSASQSSLAIYKKVCTTETSYSVTYDYNYDKTNDLPVDNNEYTAGSIVTLLPKDAAAHKENCYFAGWATNKEGTGELYQAGDTYIINKSTTFYAKWVECTHDNQLNVEILGDETHEITISWDKVEGANSYMVFLFGESKLGDEKDYTFITSNLSEVINTDNVEVGEYMFEVTPYKDRAIVGCGNDGVITLTDIPTYTVSIATNIQNGTVTSDNLIAKEGDIITLTANPANGYQFESWSVTKEGGGQVNVTDNKFTMPASNVTVSAIFSLIPTLATPDNLRVSNLSCSGVTLAWDKVDGASNYQLIRTNKSTNSPITTQVDQKDNPSVYCTLSAGTSWSWTVQAIGDGLTYNSSEVATGEDFTLHYTITYNENGGSTVGDDCGTTLPAELPTTTKSHYTFAGWYMDEEFNTPATAGVKLTQNTTLYAKWEEIKFTITWSINGNTTNSSELQEGTIINPPADLDAATYACEDKVFVGWVGASIDGSTNEEPDFITDFGNVKENKIYYAVFATPSGDGFTLGQSGDFTIYANVGSEILYASNLDNGKLGSTAQINDAVTFIFTHKGNNQYTISNGSKYLALKAYNSTDLQTQNDEYLWTIASATDGKGSWRVTSVNTTSRAIIYRSGYDFKAYGTNNINTNGYYDIEIGGATTYTEYVTSCVTCENVLTISKGNEENGTFTLDKVGEQETCEGLSIIVTLDPAEHYHVASVSASTGEKGMDNGDGTYTITYAANSTGESTINVVFEEDTKFDVTWYVNGIALTGVELGEASTKVYENDKVEKIPDNPAPPCGGMFVGWTVAEMDVDDTDEPNELYTQQSAFPPATGNQTFYAVFADYEN